MKRKKYPCEEYDDLFEDLLEGDTAIADRGVSGYRMKTITSGQYRECEIYPIFAQKEILTRGERKKKTRKVQRLLNRRNARKKLIRLLNANFTDDDIWATLTYDEKHLPATKEAAHRFFRNYVRRLDYRMKKNGWGELKYVFVTENIDDGEKVRINHHLVTNFPDRDLAEKMWKGGARTQTRRLQADDSGYEGLARYITKAREFGEKNERMWSASHNLKRPKETVSDTAVTRRRMRQMCEFYSDAEEFVRKRNAGYRLTAEIERRTSEFVPGAYIYAKMKLIS